MVTLYTIRDWDKHFETAASRLVKRLSWVAVPNKHDGKSYRRLMRREDGPTLYGAWVLIVQVASKCPTRGVLADGDGPLTPEDLAVKTDCPVELFETALKVLASPEIRWIEARHYEDGSSTLIAAMTTLPTQYRTGQTGQTGPDRTGPDPTGPDPTGQNNTGPDRTGPSDDATPIRSEGNQFPDDDDALSRTLDLANEIFDYVGGMPEENDSEFVAKLAALVISGPLSREVVIGAAKSTQARRQRKPLLVKPLAWLKTSLHNALGDSPEGTKERKAEGKDKLNAMLRRVQKPDLAEAVARRKARSQ